VIYAIGQSVMSPGDLAAMGPGSSILLTPEPTVGKNREVGMVDRPEAVEVDPAARARLDGYMPADLPAVSVLQESN